ncbi:unnamed protein product [Mesocestoides corti]|uniref:Uncharacterized protein n=2 Tax=Mesocestoides corti TaxID=53468 RepID=A0A0R3UP73_MESCO|nr:unnamed protein product [Mesocestoides corti]
MLHKLRTLSPLLRRGFSSSSVEAVAADILPPKKRHRDAVSVLRALGACVEPNLGLPDYRCAYEPWLGSSLRLRTNLLAKASGRNAARHVARHFLANDLTALATEAPRIDCMIPLQTAEFIRNELSEGRISQQEAMARLLLLLSPKAAWTLYKDAVDAVKTPLLPSVYCIILSIRLYECRRERNLQTSRQ